VQSRAAAADSLMEPLDELFGASQKVKLESQLQTTRGRRPNPYIYFAQALQH
jgi:hypothetical protein